MVTLVMLNAEAPVLVSVVVSGFDLVVFTGPKARMSGTSWTVPLVSVIAALADLVLSVTEVAVRVTAGLAGTVEGGV